MNGKTHRVAGSPRVALECPPEMRGPVQEVLAGEYEAGCSARTGERLVVLDIGANVGAFSIWAASRWPGCHVHAYEPHPGSMAMLERNLAGFEGVTCHHAAVAPDAQGRVAFWGRFPGDGEAALLAHARRTFRDVAPSEIVEVPVIHPRDLPPGDIVKLDVEGAEREILFAMDLDRVALVLLEYQSRANREAIASRLAPAFQLLHEDRHPWDDLLPGSRYRDDLAGDEYGHQFFLHRRQGRLVVDRSGAVALRLADNAPGIAHLLRYRMAGRLRDFLRWGRRHG